MPIANHDVGKCCSCRRELNTMTSFIKAAGILPRGGMLHRISQAIVLASTARHDRRMDNRGRMGHILYTRRSVSHIHYQKNINTKQN